jgi:hypothetical protein
MNWRRIFCRFFRRHVWTAIEPVLDSVDYRRLTFRLADGRWYRVTYERCRFCGSQRVRSEELASDRRPHLRGAQPPHPAVVQKVDEAQAETGAYHNWYDAQQCPAWSQDETQEADGADEQHDWHKQPSVPANDSPIATSQWLRL